MMIRPAQPLDHEQLIGLIAEFRVTMFRFRGSAPPVDLPAAERKLLSYATDDHQIHVAESQEEKIVAFVVCRILANKVSVEALYVMPEYRRQGVGSLLFERAEELALRLGDQPLTNWVHPNNDRYISFLRKHGYLVLSQIELRKQRAGDGPAQQIKVGKNIFEFCC